MRGNTTTTTPDSDDITPDIPHAAHPGPKLPIISRSKGGLVAYTLIDADDYPWLIQYHWFIKNGYIVRSAYRETGKNVQVPLHRILCGLPYYNDGRLVDHINRDHFDNRRANLRIVGHAENMQNRVHRSFRGNALSSQYRGVFLDKRSGRWRVKSYFNRTPVWLGLYASEWEAARVAVAWRLEFMPYSHEDPDIVASLEREPVFTAKLEQQRAIARAILTGNADRALLV